MSDVFISYARSTEAEAQAVAAALRAMGYGVWRDDQLPAHRGYAEVIEERLKAAKAVVVVWSAEAVKSEWVQSEADRARADRKLVQLRVDQAPLPMPFDRMQCADLIGWAGEADAPGWRKVVASLADLAGPVATHRSAPTPAAAVKRLSICVLPFANMSGDPEQEYFSDGISEDIITDLSKVSALSVVARNTAFALKARSVDVREVARQLGVGHVLEGSVRKAGGRVRITAQLIDGVAGDHVWAERYDRDLTDIFALQDEISQAIVAALKLKLLPQEKQAIERRGTESVDAYNLYLMARQYYIVGGLDDVRRVEPIARLCKRAVEIDPGYARAWALLAFAQGWLRTHGQSGDGGLAAAERAIELDPNLAEAHAVKARGLERDGRREEASAEIEIALRLDPDSYEANRNAGVLATRRQQYAEAIPYLEKAAALMQTGVVEPGLLIACYRELGDAEATVLAARTTLARVEAHLAQDQINTSVMSYGVTALTALGETDRARAWIDRALLIDPENLNARLEFAKALARLEDRDAALNALAPLFENAGATLLGRVKADADLAPLRDDPRYQALLAAGEARLAATQEPHPAGSSDR